MVVRPVRCRSFIGRNEELAFLRKRRLEAAKSHGGIVLVRGDPGIGKSRLLAEFIAPLAASRWRVASGACFQHAPQPYGPVLDVLACCAAGQSALEAAATKRDQLDEIVERFQRAAAKTGIVAVIEDIHWADAATLELLAFLAPKFERLRILLIASYRPDALPSVHAAAGGLRHLERVIRDGRIDLAPLSENELDRFIAETLADYTVADESRRFVAKTSEGNPFFAEELLRVAVERGPGARGEPPPLPSTLRGALLERWHALDDAVRDVIMQAAVIGRTFDLPMLAHTSDKPREAILPLVRRARDAQLVEEISLEVFRFRHALTREAVYGELFETEARSLHGSIAAALEAKPAADRSIERLAYHWHAAGANGRAARYNELAGDRAAAVHAHDDAIAFYQTALGTPTLPAEVRAAITEKVAEHYLLVSEVDRAHEAFRLAADAFAACGADDREAHCRVRVAQTAYALGMAAPTAALEKMLERLAVDSYVARGRIHLGIAWLAATFWFPSRAANHLARIDPRALDDAPDVALRFHNVAAWVAMTVNDLATFRSEHEAWMHCARNAGSAAQLAAAHYNGAACYSLFGRHTDAFAHIDRALELATGERSRHGVEGAFAISAMCAVMSGDLPRARAALEHVASTTANRVTIADAVASGTLAGVHLGDAELTARWFEAATPALLAAPETACGAGLAAVLVAAGRHAEARDVLHRAIPDCERPRGNALTLLAAARYGHPDDARRARDQLAAAASTESVERYALALFDAYAADRAGAPGTTTYARCAADGFHRLGFPLLEAAAREAAGEMVAAIALFRQCGALSDVRRLGGGDNVAAIPGPAAGRTALSPREREVVALVAHGHSNVQIARALLISHKTVEKHLSSVYAKLGFTSRTQLAAAIAVERAQTSV